MTVRYERDYVEVLENRKRLTESEIIDILTEIDYNYDSFNYGLGIYTTELNDARIVVECIPHSGSIEFSSIKIL